MANNSKQYGLIMPQKANQGLIRPRPSIFNESSGSEEEGGGATDWVKKALKREAEKPFQKKQHQVDIEKALAEDSTVYQYDEVYDQIEEKKAEMITAKKQDKKPRYIQSLMMQAEKRKREQERRNERIIQKEREAEGDKFKDKESFVTSAYRAKLEEFRQQEEEERRMDTLEAIADVTKQQDLGGFYRHLYHQTIDGAAEVKNMEGKDSENTEKRSGEHSEDKGDKVHETGIQVKTEKVNAENVESSPKDSSKSKEDDPDKKQSRHYRRRNDSSASSDSDSKNSGENLDADSDFSVDSDSSDSDSKSGSNSENENGQKKKQQKSKRKSDDQQDAVVNETSLTHDKVEETQVQKHNQEGNPDNPPKKIKVEKENENGVSVPVENIVSEKKVAKVKLNIWIKRTVGDVFESALQRYYERKANKLANRG